MGEIKEVLLNSRVELVYLVSKGAVSSSHQRELLFTEYSHRSFRASAGFLWICSYWILDYCQAQAPKGVRESDCHDCDPVSVLPGYTTSWRIMKATHSNPPTNDQVKEALRPLSAPICPHLRLNDPYVSAWYLQGCRKLRWKWYQNSPNPDCRCSRCSLKPPPTLFMKGECNLATPLSSFISGPKEIVRRH